MSDEMQWSIGDRRPVADQNARPLLLAIDNGTQSIRALVFDLDGNLVAGVKRSIEPYFSDHPGWAEQHPAVFWDAICAATQELTSSGEFHASEIRGMAVTTQRSSIVNLDAAGKPLRPAIIWLDQRRSENPPELPAALEIGAKLIGKGSALRDLRREAECNWIAEHQPDVADATDKLLLLSGYLNWRLTGKFVDSAAAQVGYLPFDFKKLRWADPRDIKWKALAVRREQLPELVPAGDLIGQLTPEAATSLGLGSGLPVIAAGTDKACEVLGSGCLDPTVASLSYGTTATVNTANRKYIEAVRPLPAYPAATPDAWNSEVMIRRGYWMVEWFKQEFGTDLVATAARQGIAAEELFDDLLATTPPGALGLVLQPYWSPGTPFPGGSARGAMIGFGDMHGRAHIYRAMIEGIAYALRDATQRLARRNGVTVERLRVAGGGSRSDQVMQITADVFGIVAERPQIAEASGLGAAINVAVGLGLHESYEAAVAAMTRVGERFEPRTANRDTYDRLYNGVYRRIYGRLAPLYRTIRDVTGYPP